MTSSNWHMGVVSHYLPVHLCRRMETKRVSRALICSADWTSHQEYLNFAYYYHYSKTTSALSVFVVFINKQYQTHLDVSMDLYERLLVMRLLSLSTVCFIDSSCYTHICIHSKNVEIISNNKKHTKFNKIACVCVC